MGVINNYLKNNAETIDDNNLYLIRFAQGAIILGMLFLYSYMLKGRARFMKSFWGSASNQEKIEIVGE